MTNIRILDRSTFEESGEPTGYSEIKEQGDEDTTIAVYGGIDTGDYLGDRFLGTSAGSSR